MVLLETVRALSLEYAIVPVIGEPDEHPGDEKYCYDGMFFQHGCSPFEPMDGRFDDERPESCWGDELAEEEIMWLNTIPGTLENTTDTSESQIAYNDEGYGLLGWAPSRPVMFIRIPSFADRGTSKKPKVSLLKSITKSDDDEDMED